MEPLTIGAGVVAFQAAKKAIELTRSALETAEDVSAISHHINDLFHHSREANKAYRANHAKNEEHGDIAPSDDLQSAISLVIHRREMAEMLKDLEYDLNKKWPTPHGEPTIWETIKREQARLQSRKIKQKREMAAIKAKEAEESKERWKRIGFEVLKFSFLIIVIVGMFFLLMNAYEQGPIR